MTNSRYDDQRDTNHDTHQEHEDHEHHDHGWHEHHNHETHGSHDHGGHGHHDHGDMVKDFKKRFYISLIVTIPILVLSPMIQDFVGVACRVTTAQYSL